MSRVHSVHSFPSLFRSFHTTTTSSSSSSFSSITGVIIIVLMNVKKVFKGTSPHLSEVGSWDKPRSHTQCSEHSCATVNSVHEFGVTYDAKERQVT